MKKGREEELGEKEAVVYPRVGRPLLFIKLNFSILQKKKTCNVQSNIKTAYANLFLNRSYSLTHSSNNH